VQLDDATRSVQSVDVQGVTASLVRPDPVARLEVATQRQVVWSATTRTGTFVWSSSAEGTREPVPLLALNEFLAGFAEGAKRLIAYRALSGDSLRGYVILPVNYQPGRRYPLVAWVYAGAMVRDTMSTMSRINNPFVLNLQLFAARGYAVLVPSQPIGPEGVAGNPLDEMPNGIIPAIDRVIELGIADSSRLAIAGQSYGGYTTMGMITQTTRFKAAVSLAGLSDLISSYGAFDIRRRYFPDAADYLLGTSFSETGQLRMGAPVWQDPSRYVRNSPLFRVTSIETPLLLVQGDQDYVSMAQGEAMFTALHRLGKPVRFVRYWGEGHVLNSPANIRHMWSEIFAWLEAHLGGPESPSSNEARGR
jgi:dipeptidyl aminopeptidase/acylaminoacyl peptidase